MSYFRGYDILGMNLGLAITTVILNSHLFHLVADKREKEEKLITHCWNVFFFFFSCNSLMGIACICSKKNRATEYRSTISYTTSFFLSFVPFGGRLGV